MIKKKSITNVVEEDIRITQFFLKLWRNGTFLLLEVYCLGIYKLFSISLVSRHLPRLPSDNTVANVNFFRWDDRTCSGYKT